MNFDSEGRGAFSPSPPRIQDLYYAGIDRMPWFDFNEDYYSNSLPSDVLELRKTIKDANKDRPDYELCSDINAARTLLEYSNRSTSVNELIAIYSEKLVPIKGVVNCDAKLIWLGVDIDCSGFGSQIREGIFSKPEVFTDFFQSLNKNGLFDRDSEDIDRYIEAYLDREKQANLEPMSDVVKYLDKIHLARVEI